MSDTQKNPFKELEQSVQEAPLHLKKKVMSDIATAKMVIDMASLFTCNYKSALEGMLKTEKK